LTAPAKVIEIDIVEESADSDAEGAASSVIRRACLRAPVIEEAEPSDSNLAEALTLAARAGRWDVVAQLAAVRRFKP